MSGFALTIALLICLFTEYSVIAKACVCIICIGFALILWLGRVNTLGRLINRVNELEKQVKTLRSLIPMAKLADILNSKNEKENKDYE